MRKGGWVVGGVLVTEEGWAGFIRFTRVPHGAGGDRHRNGAIKQ
jgi:hypothetical protein